MTPESTYVKLKELSVLIERSYPTVCNWVRWGLLDKNSEGLVSVEQARQVRALLRYERTYGSQKGKAPRFSRGGHTQIENIFLYKPEI
jgi:hypothetical protein